MNSKATDPQMIEALEGASSLQLYWLKALIEGMLAYARRGIAVRASLNLGQAVQFANFRDGQMHRGKLIAMKDSQVTVLELGIKLTGRSLACRRRATPTPSVEVNRAVRAAAGARHDGEQGTRVPARRHRHVRVSRRPRHLRRHRAHQPTYRHDRLRRQRKLARAAPILCRALDISASSSSCIARRQGGLEAALAPGELI